jgi:hypothetical protein
MSNHTTAVRESAQLFVQGALKAGVHPHAIRKVLAKDNVKWNYGFTTRQRINVADLGADPKYRRLSHQNVREKSRRLKQLGLKPCIVCKNGMAVSLDGDTCYKCLESKFGGTI